MFILECEIKDSVHGQESYVPQDWTVKTEPEDLIGVESSSCDEIGHREATTVEVKQEELEITEIMPQFETYFMPEFNGE
jgi:hypothetical protein